MLDGPKSVWMKIMILFLGWMTMGMDATPNLFTITSYFPPSPCFSATMGTKMKESRNNAHTITRTSTSKHFLNLNFRKPKHSIIVKSSWMWSWRNGCLNTNNIDMPKSKYNLCIHVMYQFELASLSLFRTIDVSPHHTSNLYTWKNIVNLTNFHLSPPFNNFYFHFH